MTTHSAIIVALLAFLSIAYAGPLEPRCPNDSYLYENGFCYLYQFQSTTWEAANKACTDLNSHLVSIRDIARNTYVKIQAAPVSFWFGLKKDDSGSLEWTDEPRKFDINGFSDWRKHEPSDAGQCVSMTFDFGENASSAKGGWAMASCEKLLPSVCVIPALNA